MYFGGWFYTANAFYSKTSLFYFTDILTYKKQLLPIPFINGWTVLHSGPVKPDEKMGYDWAKDLEHVAFGMVSMADGTRCV